MEYFNNTLCITGSELIIKRDSSRNIIGGVIEKYEYDNLKRRGHIRVHGYGGRGREVYIEFDTITRPDIKKLIREKLGDPREKAEVKPFQDSIQPDPKAVEYFNNYRTEDEKPLSESLKEKYCNDAAIFNAIHTIFIQYKTRRIAVGASTKNFWGKALKAVNDYRLGFKMRFEREMPCTLPDSEKRLRMRYESYLRDGYKALISDRIGNNNSEKINEDAKIWLLATWVNKIEIVPGESQMLQVYNTEADKKGWKKLKNVGTIHNFLFREDIKALWWAHRYGELKAKEKFAFQHSTLLPSMRDSLWYSDGTKLNFYYQDETGKMCTCQVYEVMDVFSENLLGYHISETEDFEAQFMAYKMAFKTSGQKPYEIRYDNQGGHKKLENSNFLKNIAHLSIRTAPYNGKSKTIESAFGRFQAHILKKEWFFTGQNITAKKLESKANMEYILANKENLPTKQEAVSAYLKRRNEWCSSAHYKTNEAHNKMYFESNNPKAVKVELWDFVNLFWITREKEVACHASGISFVEKGNKYEYLVYKQDRMPDHEWLSRNIDKKFIIKFDPEDMSLIYMYEKSHDGLRFVCQAETKVMVHRAKQEQEDWEAEYFKKNELEAKRLRIERVEKMDSILETHNLLPEQHGFNSPHIKGISKKVRKAVKVDIGSVQKAESNAVMVDDDDFDEKSIYNLY